VYVYQTRKISE